MADGLWLLTGSRVNIRLSLRFEKENPLSDEPVVNDAPVLHGLPAAAGSGIKDVQTPALPLAQAIGRGAGRRLNGQDSGPVPRQMPWVGG